jgi:hypothetical protein
MSKTEFVMEMKRRAGPRGGRRKAAFDEDSPDAAKWKADAVYALLKGWKLPTGQAGRVYEAAGSNPQQVAAEAYAAGLPPWVVLSAEPERGSFKMVAQLRSSKVFGKFQRFGEELGLESLALVFPVKGAGAWVLTNRRLEDEPGAVRILVPSDGSLCPIVMLGIKQFTKEARYG